jgi:hypothetical protein
MSEHRRLAVLIVRNDTSVAPVTPEQAKRFDIFLNRLTAGPMLSRANLHFFKPGALDATNKVRHIYEGGADNVITLYPAGQGDVGKRNWSFTIPPTRTAPPTVASTSSTVSHSPGTMPPAGTQACPPTEPNSTIAAWLSTW